MSDESKTVDQDESKTKDHQDKPYADLVEAIKDKLELYVSSHVVSLFKTTDESLFDAANKASNMDEQNRMFEFMNALRAEKDGIEKNFIRELNLFIRPISEARGAPKKKQDSDQDAQLGLIDQDDMDEMVALSSISSKAAGDNREAISHLEARLEHLALQNNSIFPPKALQPKNLCEAFKEAIAICDFEIKNKLFFYKQFAREMVSPLRELYKELNETMIEAGVLPQIDLSGKVKHPTHEEQPDEEVFSEDEPQPGASAARRGGSGARPAGGSGSAGNAGTGPMGGAAGGMGPGGGAMGGAAGGMGPGGGAMGGASGGMGPGGGAMGGASGGMGSGGGAGGGAGGMSSADAAGAQAGGTQASTGNGGAGSSPSTESGTGGYTAGMPVSQVRESISNFIGGEPTKSDQSVSGRGSGGGGYYTHQDVVTALSSLQSSATRAAPGAKLEFDAAAIKKAVLTSIGEKHGGVVDKRVNQVSEKTIDFIKLIFDAIIADETITDAIKALLLSLQIPVIKAAMIDADFFVDDHHPARQLLDKLAEAGVGVSDHKDQVYIEIDKIVKKLLNDYDEDVEAFNVALQELNEQIEKLGSKAKEREAEAQRKLKHAHARNVVLQEIRKITLGHELPVGVHALVLKVWPSLMFNHFLHFGKANDEWVEMLMILAKIIDSVQPLHNTAELKSLGLGYEDIITATQSKLKVSKRSAAQIEEVIAGLRTTYEELMATENLPDTEEADVEEIPAPISEESAPAEGMKSEAEIIPVVSTATEEVVAEIESAEAEPDTAEQIARRKVEALPDDVQPGAWFIVYNGDDKPVRRLKLAVILTQTATLMFVDHLGNIVIEKDAEEFGNELKQDLSGIIMQHSVFDHALNSALKSINQ